MQENCLQSYFKLTVNVHELGTKTETEANIQNVLNPGAARDNL